jgi:Leu/Phe-tRNA-protein transferase
LIDCQVASPHLESLGAHQVPRREFMAHLRDWAHPMPAKWA